MVVSCVLGMLMVSVGGRLHSPPELSIYQHIHFRGLDAAAIHLREAKTRT